MLGQMADFRLYTGAGTVNLLLSDPSADHTQAEHAV